MVGMTLRYEGDLRVTADHGPSEATIVTDAPADNGGQGRAFSPTDLLAASLGSCVLTTMGLAARRDGFDLGGATADVEKHMSETGPRRIARLVVRIGLPAGMTDDRRRAMERAAAACPVHRSLHPDLQCDITIRSHNEPRLTRNPTA